MTDSRDIERARDAWFEEFSEDWLRRGMLQLLPGGGPIDAMISGRVARVQRERFERFALDVYEELSTIDRDKVDWSFFSSADGVDWFMEAWRQAQRTSDEQKLAALRNAFVSGTTTRWSGSPTRDLIMRIVGDLSVAQVHVLRSVAEGQRPLQPGEAASVDDGPSIVVAQEDPPSPLPFLPISAVHEAVPQLTPAELEALAGELLRLGLLDSWWKGTIAGLDGRADRLTLTPFGRDVLDFIGRPG